MSREIGSGRGVVSLAGRCDFSLSACRMWRVSPEYLAPRALVKLLQMSQPAVSKQLRVLREAGLASVRVDAQRRFYNLNPDGLREIDEWLVPYRVFWEDRLDDMERTLDSMED